MDRRKKFLITAVVLLIIGFGLLAMAYNAYSIAFNYDGLIDREMQAMEDATSDEEREEALFFMEEHQRSAAAWGTKMYLYGGLGVIFLILGGVVFVKRK